MSFFVVDTNVPIVANGKCEQASPGCVISCINALDEIYNGGIILLDELMLILNEYRGNLNMSGEPGPGDAFMNWVFNNQAVTDVCQLVHISPMEGEEANFLEFPQTPKLKNFDRSDRKFVAVALGSGVNPEILNAVDSDWIIYFKPLTKAGVKITLLC